VLIFTIALAKLFSTPHAGVSNCNAGLGPLAIFLACGDFKMGVATIYVANSLVPVAAQNKENG